MSVAMITARNGQLAAFQAGLEASKRVHHPHCVVCWDRHPFGLQVDYRATIRGEWLRGEGPIHLLHATLEQGGQVRASTRAKFFEGKPSQPMPGGAKDQKDPFQ